MNSTKCISRFTGPILMLAIWSGTALAASDDIRREFTVQPGGSFVLDSDGGSVSIRTGSDTLVVVQVRNPDDMEVSFEQTGNDVVVTAEQDGSRNRIRTQFIVEVPRQFYLDLVTQGGSIDIPDQQGDIRARTAGGSIDIGNVEGMVDAETAGGSISTGNVSGLLMVQTAGGSITLGDAGADVTAETAGGSITVGEVAGSADLQTAGGSIDSGYVNGMAHLDTAGGSIELTGSSTGVEARTAGGSITIDRSEGPVDASTAGGSITLGPIAGSITARTAGGSIEATLAEVADGVDASITLVTSGGDVDLWLPGDHGATVDAHIEVSRRYRGDYRIYTDFPLTIQGEEERDIIGRGDINGGGDLIRLETANGDISLRRRD